MARSPQFVTTLILLLLVPAAVYLLVGLYNGRTMGVEYLLPNYLFMAAPHLLVSLLAVRPSARRSPLLWTLALLNALLVAFQIWVLLAVPTNESGLAWVLYIPLWASAISACAIAWIVVKYSGRKGDTGQSVGT